MKDSRKLFLSVIQLNLLVLLFYCTINANAQSDTTDRSFLLETSGIRSTYRDLATSPLYYTGYGLSLGLGWDWKKKQSESSVFFDLSGSILRSVSPESNLIPSITRSYMASANFFTEYLRRIPLQNNRWRLFLGGSSNLSLPFRYNPSLGNSALGADPLLNLMGAGRVRFDVSRKEERTFSFWFISRQLVPVRRYFQLDLHAGLFNFNYRPGYAYTYDASIQGNDTRLLNYYFDNYKWSLNGWRIQTRLSFFRESQTGNGFQLFYAWEATVAKGRFEPLALAIHKIGIRLNVQRKPRIK